MKTLKIRIFRPGESKPKTTITVPLALAGLACKLIPRSAIRAMEKEEIDIAAMLKSIKEEKIVGPLVEIEKEDEKIMVAVE